MLLQVVCILYALPLWVVIFEAVVSRNLLRNFVTQFSYDLSFFNHKSSDLVDLTTVGHATWLLQSFHDKPLQCVKVYELGILNSTFGHWMCLQWVFVRNHSREKFVQPTCCSFQASKTHFRRESFAWRLALKPRYKVGRIWPSKTHQKISVLRQNFTEQKLLCIVMVLIVCSADINTVVINSRQSRRVICNKIQQTIKRTNERMADRATDGKKWTNKPTVKNTLSYTCQPFFTKMCETFRLHRTYISED